MTDRVIADGIEQGAILDAVGLQPMSARGRVYHGVGPTVSRHVVQLGDRSVLDGIVEHTGRTPPYLLALGQVQMGGPRREEITDSHAVGAAPRPAPGPGG